MWVSDKQTRSQFLNWESQPSTVWSSLFPFLWGPTPQGWCTVCKIQDAASISDQFISNNTPATNELVSTHMSNSLLYIYAQFTPGHFFTAYNLSRITSVLSSYPFVTTLHDAGCYCNHPHLGVHFPISTARCHFPPYTVNPSTLALPATCSGSLLMRSKCDRCSAMCETGTTFSVT